MTFSIIIPCYNCATTIKRALQSVAVQTFQDFEVILVDDGSSDNTRDVIETFFAKRSLSYHYSYQDNAGAGSARNRAVSHACGEYLAFLDADDEWREDKLEIQYAIIKQYNARFVSCIYTLEPFCDTQNHTVKCYEFWDFLISNRTSTPCTILSRELFKEVGGFLDGQRYSEDYFLWLKVAYKEPLYFIVQPSLTRLYKRTYGESGLSSNLWEMEKGELANYTFCYKNKYINFLQYIFFIIFSFSKYAIRVIKCSLLSKIK